MYANLRQPQKPRGPRAAPPRVAGGTALYATSPTTSPAARRSAADSVAGCETRQAAARSFSTTRLHGDRARHASASDDRVRALLPVVPRERLALSRPRVHGLQVIREVLEVLQPRERARRRRVKERPRGQRWRFAAAPTARSSTRRAAVAMPSASPRGRPAGVPGRHRTSRCGPRSGEQCVQPLEAKRQRRVFAKACRAHVERTAPSQPRAQLKGPSGGRLRASASLRRLQRQPWTLRDAPCRVDV